MDVQAPEPPGRFSLRLPVYPPLQVLQQFPPIAPMPYVTMMSEQSAGDLTSIGL
jgi:hypothetical protein